MEGHPLYRAGSNLCELDRSSLSFNQLASRTVRNRAYLVITSVSLCRG